MTDHDRLITASAANAWAALLWRADKSGGQAVRWRFSANARASSRERLSEPQRTARFPKCFHGSARYGKGVVNVVPRYTPQWMAVLAALSPESNAFVGGLPCRYS